MGITAAEQYGIELLNRGRLDPAAEAARYHVALNKGVYGDDRITTAQKQVLAPDQALDTSATRHSNWMIDSGNFSHTGAGGTNPQQRMAKAGYSFNGGWSYGENLAFVGAAGRSAAKLIDIQHKMLMLSSDHRPNILRSSFREIGYSQEFGKIQGSYGSALTQNYAHRSVDIFVTGVAYTDKNGNNFYTVGEGLKGIHFSVEGGAKVATAQAGGYAVKVAAGTVTVDISSSTRSIGTVELTNVNGNVKLDLVGGNTVFVAGNATLVDGIDNIRLLGINGNKLTGSDDANNMVGNKGSNLIDGNDGNDTLTGGKGNDTLIGGGDNDVLVGGEGNDLLRGGLGNDRMTGGAGADSFEFGVRGGNDVVFDFAPSKGDKLRLDDAIWGEELSFEKVVETYAEVVGKNIVIDFDNGQTITLQGFTNMSALADAIIIF